MKKFKLFFVAITFFFIIFITNSTKVNASDSEGNVNLGYTYSSTQTIFKIMSKTAKSVSVIVEDVENGTKSLVKDGDIWIGYVAGDLNGKEYSFIIENEEGIIHENVLDPYGKFLNETGTKNVICDELTITFEQWDEQNEYLVIKDKNKIIYGINVANFTSHSSWKGAEEKRGKLLGLIETISTGSYLTGYDYVKSLGVTYLELSNVNNVNSPYSISNEFILGTERFSGNLELKQVVNGYYLNNIGVIMPFDYKMLSDSFLETLNKVDGESYLNTEGTLDLNKEATQKYIIDLLTYYTENYKLSGIKIKNMSDYSVDLINTISESLKLINNNILIYGEGSYQNQDNNKAGENNLDKLNNVKMYNGSLSYAMFGDLTNKDIKGILEGNYSDEIIETLKFSLMSSVDNGEIDYSKIQGISYKNYWGNTSSYQLINSMGKENGLSLYDKLLINNLSGENIIKQKIILSFGTMMMSGGIPYIYSGEEFMMSYLDVNNESGSECTENGAFCFHKDEKHKIIDWNFVNNNETIVDAFKALINYRKSGSSIIQTDSASIKTYVRFYQDENYKGVIGFTRTYPNVNNGEIQKIFVVFNYSNNDYTVTEMESKGWYGLYTYNSSSRDGENIMLKSLSIYSEMKKKQPKINSWITLILVLSVIGLLYYANIVLNRKLVEKKGYDIKQIKKKYRPFIKNIKNNESEECENQKNESQDVINKQTQNTIYEQDEENKNGNE